MKNRKDSFSEKDSYWIKKTLLIMKITTFLLTVNLLYVSASTYSQNERVTLNLNQSTAKEVFASIERQTNYKFLYRDSDVNTIRVSMNVTKTPVSSVLNATFENTNNTFKLLENGLIVIASKTELQQQVITGKVIDEVTKEPLIGVNISVEGTTTGVVTDMNGNFTINLPEGNESILIFAYLGFVSQRIPVGNQTEINVSMITDIQNLEEVIVIGYGTQKKATITGSVVSASGKDLGTTPASSINNTLIGRLPGLIATNTSGEPGYDDSNILIRGKSTMGYSAPLIVIDGVADREGGLNRIDVNDIESISVLKDASAAIYGSRAANGVLLITTKRGNKGTPKVNYAFNYGMKKPTVLPKMCNSAEFATLLNEIDTLINSGNGVYSAEEIELFRNGSDPVNYPNANYLDAAMKDGFSSKMQHSLTMNAGNEKIQFFGSLGYQFEDNYYKNSASNYNQYNFRSNIDIKASDRLKLGANISLRQENRNAPSYGSETIWRYLLKADPRVPYVEPGTDNPLLIQDLFNPITAVNGDMGYQHDKRFFVNADLTYDYDMSFITQGLSIKGQVSFDKGFTFYKNWFNSFYLYEWNTSEEDYLPELQGISSLYENYYQNTSYTANIRLNYNRTFGKHAFNSFVGYEQFENRYDHLYAKREGFVSTEIDELSVGLEGAQTNEGDSDEGGRINYFGRFDYSYDDKYLFQFNFRDDGSENFASGHQFGFFPGVSAGWRISEESFWKDNINIISYLKLRASVGQIGNDILYYNNARQKYGYITQYELQQQNAVNSDGSVVSGARIYISANKNLTWETATMYNYGLDGKILNSIDFSFDYFKTYRKDMLGKPSSSVPDYAGLYSGGNDITPYVNMLKCESNGLEVTLGYNKKIGDFLISASGNLSYATNKITFSDEAQSIEYKKETGMPIDADWILYESTGIFRTQEQLDTTPILKGTEVGDLIFRDKDEDGDIDADDMVRQSKTSTPEIIYGFNFGLTYKQWQLSMLWQGADRVWQYVFRESGTEGNFTKDYYDNRSTPSNNYMGKYPRVYDRTSSEVGQLNTFWLQDASYLRLKSIEISYTLPKSITERLPISNLRIYTSAFNLLTFTGLKDLDPETVAGGQNFTGWSTPQSKIINFGFNVTF